MPIELTCQCGRDLYLRDELAGKQVRCPDCLRTLTVPYAIRPVVLEEARPDAAAAHADASGYDPLRDRSEESKPVEPAPRPLPPLAPRPGTGGVNASKVVGG